MVDKKECNGHGDASTVNNRIMVSNVAPVNVNGTVLEHEIGFSGVIDDIEWITYKRRNDAKSSEGEKVWHDSESNCVQKLLAQTSLSSCASLKLYRNIVLEQICQSLEAEDVLKECIQNAIVSNPGCDGGSTAQGSAHFCENANKCNLRMGMTCNGLEDKVIGRVEGMSPSGSVNKLNHFSASELCLSVMYDIFVSDKFAQLCNLFLENFQGMKVDKILNLHLINSRMKDNAYESSPVLFHSDIQQEWSKLEKVGADIITLAKFLSEKTSTSYQERGGSSVHIFPNDSINGFGMHTKLERAEARALYESNTCRCCREKADGRSCLVCDSCEEMYHITCVEPPVKEIPIRSWYCGNCTAEGIESPHDNCIACERLSMIPDGNEEDDVLSDPEKLEGCSVELVGYEECKGSRDCKFCCNEIKENEDHRECGHAFCSQKLYHLRCLSNTELISHGPCWYCPSCLCRTCLKDQDDDKILLCDGCDHAYHTYCVTPRLSTIPEGKWFCQNCSSGLQQIREAKRLHNKMQSMSEKRLSNGKLKQKKTSQKSGGVDMLLNAAQTLICEDNLAATGLQINGAHKR